jgi:hypothetical protein
MRSGEFSAPLAQCKAFRLQHYAHRLIKTKEAVADQKLAHRWWVRFTQQWHTCMQRVAAPCASQTLVCVVRAKQAMAATTWGRGVLGVARAGGRWITKAWHNHRLLISCCFTLAACPPAHAWMRT